VKLIIFPAKLFPGPAKYENNFTRNIWTTSTDAAYLLTYPNTQMHYDQFVYAELRKYKSKKTFKMLDCYMAIRMGEEGLARHDCSESSSEVDHLSGENLSIPRQVWK
jgi:hypothetical protein